MARIDLVRRCDCLVVQLDVAWASRGAIAQLELQNCHPMNTGKRIVFATHGTFGDLHPYLALALELKARGHRPLIATSEFYRRKVEADGIEFHPIRPDISFDNKELHRRLTEPKRGLEHVIRELMLPVLRATYDDLMAAVNTDGRADLLVSQILIFAAPLIAEQTRVRWVSTELQPGAFMSAYDPPVIAAVPALAKLRSLGSTFHRAVFRVPKLIGRSWSEPVRQLRLQLGLPKGKNPLFEGRHSPHRVLALFSPAIGAAQPDWPPNTVITGFPFYDERHSELSLGLEEFLIEGEPPIVFTLGSSAVWDAGSFYSDSVEAAKRLGRRAVLLVGNDSLNQPCEKLPASITSITYAPYAQIFARASIVVHQGGIGTTAQALRAGKPMLVMPFGGDQYDNASRAERLGVGRTIMRNRYTAAAAAIEIERILDDPSYRQRAVDLARRLESEDGVRVACDALEDQLSQAP